MQYAEPFRYQMMLPLPQNINYLQYYLRAGTDKNRYVILDNGAWEEQSLHPDELIAKAHAYKVQELVAPDVLNDPIGTVRAMQYFFTRWDRFCQAMHGEVKMSFMAVAHGDTIAKAAKFIDHVARFMPLVETIAAGRAFSRACNDPHARVQLAMLVDDEYSERFGFHLLGYNDAWAGEIGACRGIVRSLDTCAPFTAAHYGKGMRDILEFNTPRPPNYFDMVPTDFDLDLLAGNIKRLTDYADHPEPRQIPLRDVSPVWPPITT
jgi:hypothetical protein